MCLRGLLSWEARSQRACRKVAAPQGPFLTASYIHWLLQELTRSISQSGSGTAALQEGASSRAPNAQMALTLHGNFICVRQQKSPGQRSRSQYFFRELSAQRARMKSLLAGAGERGTRTCNAADEKELLSIPQLHNTVATVVTAVVCRSLQFFIIRHGLCPPPISYTLSSLYGVVYTGTFKDISANRKECVKKFDFRNT